MIVEAPFVLVLYEVPYHPNSYIKKMVSKFEVTSVLNITRKDELRRYQKPPLFDEKYLVIFEDSSVFLANKSYINFSTMFPVIKSETRVQYDDACFACKEHDIPYKTLWLNFTKEDAMRFIAENVSQSVSDEFCKTVIRQVGLSPMRIISALGVCEQVGYTREKVLKYVDKYVYLDIRRLIECLLGVPKSKAAVTSARVYLHTNRHWYHYVSRNLLDEIDTILSIYRDKLQGELSPQSMLSYLEEKHVSRRSVTFALSLFNRVSIVSLYSLREFIKTASLMEVALRIC